MCIFETLGVKLYLHRDLNRSALFLSNCVFIPEAPKSSDLLSLLSGMLGSGFMPHPPEKSQPARGYSTGLKNQWSQGACETEPPRCTPSDREPFKGRWQLRLLAVGQECVPTAAALPDPELPSML